MKTWLPFSYLIDYSSGHIGNEEYYRTVAEAPPRLLHLGQDVAFSADLGLLYGEGELQRRSWTSTRRISRRKGRMSRSPRLRSM